MQSAGRSLFSLDSVWYCFPPGHWDAFFSPNELFMSKMKYRFCGQFIKKNTSFMWAVFRPTGNLYVEIIYGYEETPHKKNDYMVSSCNLYAFFFNKKMCVQTNLFFFYCSSARYLKCSCLTFWLLCGLFVVVFKKSKPSTLCFQLQSLFVCERCNKGTFLHWRKLK